MRSGRRRRHRQKRLRTSARSESPSPAPMAECSEAGTPYAFRSGIQLVRPQGVSLTASGRAGCTVRDMVAAANTPSMPPGRRWHEHLGTLRYGPEIELDPMIHRYTAPVGVELAYRQVGEGQPLLLVHGFSSDSRQWIGHGLAAALAAPGHRVIMPDLRGHGASARPHLASAYPPDVLADDGLALVSAFGLPNNGYDLVGYSMGARVVLRMLVGGARPARAVVGGQGFDVTRSASGRIADHRRLLRAMVEGTHLAPQERSLADRMAQRAEGHIGMPVQATVRPLAKWRGRADDPFIAGSPRAPSCLCSGTSHELGAGQGRHRGAAPQW